MDTSEKNKAMMYIGTHDPNFGFGDVIILVILGHDHETISLQI